MKRTRRDQLERDHQPEAIRRRLGTKRSAEHVSDAVLGGIDGCVTTFAVVSGAVGAGFPSSVALVLGFANLFADGFSMAVSNFESIRAQHDFVAGIRRTEQEHIDLVPDGEREEIRQIFSKKGFEGDTLDEIVETICQDQHLWIDTMLAEEYGVQRTPPEPRKAALITFAAFVSVGAMPLIPFMLPGGEMQQRFIISAAIAAVVFFLIGMLKSLVFSMPMLFSGLRTLVTGGGAAALAYLTGYLLRTLFDIGFS